VDGGATWKEITGGGLPNRLTGKMWVAVANTTNAQRVYVIGDSGLYRSDDGGATWRQMASDDPRIRNGQGGYNCGVYVDPQNPDPGRVTLRRLNRVEYRNTVHDLLGVDYNTDHEFPPDDSGFGFDNNAEFRHPDLEQLRDLSEEEPIQ
jgi:hypothetical protein